MRLSLGEQNTPTRQLGLDLKKLACRPTDRPTIHTLREPTYDADATPPSHRREITCFLVSSYSLQSKLFRNSYQTRTVVKFALGGREDRARWSGDIERRQQVSKTLIISVLQCPPSKRAELEGRKEGRSKSAKLQRPSWQARSGHSLVIWTRARLTGAVPSIIGHCFSGCGLT